MTSSPVMPPFDVSVLRDRVTLADGGWSTELWRRGLPRDIAPELSNLELPDVVRDVARSYAAAGSRIVLTNTFGANSVRLARLGRRDSAAEINAAGVTLTRQGVAGAAWVFASIGPSGRELLGRDVSDDELRAVFTEQADALHRAGADALIVETMSNLDEAAIAVSCAAATGLTVVGCLSFHTGVERNFGEVVDRLVAAGATVLGANCGAGVEEHVEIARRFRGVWRGPLWIKANAGQPEIVDDRLLYHTTPAAYAEAAMDLVAAGANVIGGCCGTTPEFIAAIHSRLGDRGNAG